MDNFIINNNILETVNEVVEIMRREEETAMAESMRRCVKNMYNKHHRQYMNDNPDKRKAIQQKYRETHPKTESDKLKDKEYARLYYLKNKEIKRNINMKLINYLNHNYL